MSVIGEIILMLLKVLPILSVYHEPSMIVISLPNGSQPDAMLGFSMAYYNKHLFISAPKYGNGRIFDYDVLKNKSVKEISLPNVDDGRSYWFGAVLKAGSEFLVTCAPRLWYQTYNHKTRGLCYSLTNNTLREFKDIPSDQINYYSNSGLDTAGWSIEVDAEDFVLIGSPAVSLRGIVKFYHNQRALPRVFLNLIKSYNFGYAIASGNFLSDNEICYAISTTFGDFGEGMVFILNKDNKELLRLSGTEVGGLYGAALCKVNLYGSRSSLLVGSPTFSERSDPYDNGAVYLYVNEGAKDLTLKRIIKGNKNGGYFGFAIASLGDLDGDGREEVAIGAPYEDDLKGAVYIYTGASLLSGNTWLQKIQPEEYQTIGHSLVPLDNCFNSGCNELAVGAPFSDKAFILKCNSHITVNLEAFFPNIQMRTNRTFFVFAVCTNIEYPKKHSINSSISIKVDINHPDASLENENGTFAFPIGSDVLYCKNVTVLTPIEGNYDELIAYKISASLINVANNEYSSSRAVLSERSKVEIQGQVSAADCEGRERCVPILTATLQSNITEPFVVGSDNASFSLSLLNSGESAYSACAHVLVSGAHVFRHPSTCTRPDQTEQVICKPARPITTNDVWRIGEIQIDTDTLTSEDENITITYVVYSHCNNHEDRQRYEKIIRLGYDTEGIVVNGISNPSDLVNFTSEDAAKKQQLEHVYLITNNGLTHWVGVKCEVLLEKSPYFNYSVSIVDKTTESCILNEGETNLTATCDVGDLKHNVVKNIIVCIELHPNTLDDIIRAGNAYVVTRLAVLLKQERLVQRLTTKLALVSTSAPAWIIILALLLGLIIICLIIYVLYKKKCFQRKNKKKLNNLKASLYIKDRGNRDDCDSDSN
ncbi:integrin alpha-4-like [Danaus plexippus]|uniref:integrin alpha-4-like n=1 Tax=Danaus plexippus TaxID=13037 RepID=UPI002AB0AA2E|nr:integrin alpha-4-like [Danaus plexippus]